jgi:vacuolar-type H+-ATPase subunit H
MNGLQDILTAEKESEQKLENAKLEAQRLIIDAKESADKKISEEIRKLEEAKQQKLRDQKEELKSVYTKIIAEKSKETISLANSAEPKVAKLVQKLIRSLT